MQTAGGPKARRGGARTGSFQLDGTQTDIGDRRFGTGSRFATFER